MTDPPRSADADYHVTAYPGAPRWVKAFGVIAILVVLLVILRLTVFGGHGHGPGRHLRAADDAPAEAASAVDDPARSSGAAGGHTPPHGGH